jgi:RNA polymerase sigma-70 factor (ECF subfamily)
MAALKSDEELMDAYVAGDATAFRALFDRYAPLLARVLSRRVRSGDLARDLVQQTFLQLHRARNDFRQGARLRPWLFTIALNLQREHLRRQGRRPEAPLELDGRQDPAVGPHGVERLDAAQTLWWALDRIHPDHREVIVLHWFEGLSFSEISELCGVSVTAVKVRAHRGYVALRGLLSGNQEPGHGIPPGGSGGLR